MVPAGVARQASGNNVAVSVLSSIAASEQMLCSAEESASTSRTELMLTSEIKKRFVVFDHGEATVEATATLALICQATKPNDGFEHWNLQ